MAELVHQGAVCHAILERRDDVGISHTWELMALSCETLNVISDGLA
jgi:hypothetical protein